MEIKIEEQTCATEGCGMTFWVSEAWGERRRADKKSFCCPNGHSLVYSGETDKAKAARILGEKMTLEREKNYEINELKRKLRKKCKSKK